MLIKNALLKDGIFDILITDGKIEKIGKLKGEATVDAEGKYVIPGMIDVHMHGFGGVDVLDCNLQVISDRLAKEGTTCYYPTTMTVSREELIKSTNQPKPTRGAIVAGYHLEGPFISPKKKGAQNELYIKAPDNAFLDGINEVKRITIAPEMPGAMEFIKNADINVTIGHTNCDYDTAVKAFEAGASCLTHTFNAMPPLLHRQPGPIGAGFECGSYAEVICDGMHIHKAAVKALYKMFTSDRLIFVSDTIRPGGLPNGKNISGGLEIFIKDGRLTLEDGTLAGGSTPLLGCVRKAVEFGIDFYEAVKMASETPAKMMGLNKGIIKEGYDADLLILNDDLTLNKTIIGGEIYKD